MSQFHRVTDRLSVAPQIGVEDVRTAAESGFVLLINNRPDGEEPGQAEGEAIEAAARAAGLDYVAIPVRGGPTREQAQAFHDRLAAADGPVLAYCRSGNRSICTWAVGEAMAGRPADELLQLGADAGYDLRPVLAPLLG
jgi:uncharacterized protein (TIGR01244 family)